MKATKFILAAMAVAIAMTSCGFGKSATTTTQSATTSSAANAVTVGKNAGNSIDQLTAQYKADGKLDMTNIMNIANTLNLVGAAQQLYQNKSSKEYRQSFVKGMIANSINIDEMNAESITTQLEDLAEQTNVSQLQEAMQKGEATAEEVQKTADSVTNIINIFKK